MPELNGMPVLIGNVYETSYVHNHLTAGFCYDAAAILDGSCFSLWYQAPASIDMVNEYE